ncbi:single-strand binding protein [Halarsenatibacter silvermanii]|uniref:Single-stranded DNA-binding protein n=1 Tax=Halarsenatibacter silvermanii TaxID=321763 RepID=A0A1G9R8I9_9FIRM|nr:single-strand binding protein [Halarsenatibacter silvermanii]
MTRDVELRYTNNGTPVANFTLAVDRGFKDKDGEKKTDFIKIVVWSNLAETCAQHIGKGRLVAVDGRLQINKRKTEDRTYTNPEVVANEVRFLDWPDDKPAAPQNQSAQQKMPAKQTAGPAPANKAADELADMDLDAPF